jgi:DNA-binding transcriptional regulator LsrR (DeoR family)
MPREKGPLPRFSETHVQMALDIISRQRRIGRKQVAAKLGIGEGSVRTILDYLKEKELITSSRGGHALTDKGRSLLGEPLEFVQIEAGELAVGRASVATIVRDAAGKVKKGIEQRDEAIKAGAGGATVLVFKNGKLQFQGGFAKIGSETSEALTKALKPRDGDVVIIGAGDDLTAAEAGARAAALTLRRKSP